MPDTIAGSACTVNGEPVEGRDSTSFCKKMDWTPTRTSGKFARSFRRPCVAWIETPIIQGGTYYVSKRRFSVNRQWSNLLIGSLIVLMLVGTAQASDWSLPNLNPFQASNTRGSHQPSVWTRMTNGTKNFFSRTYDVLTPWETEAQKRRSQPSRSSAGRSDGQRNPIFRNWWAAEEEPRQPQTVSDWLKQPRP